MKPKLQRAIFAEGEVLRQLHCQAGQEPHALQQLEQCHSVLRDTTPSGSCDVFTHPSGWTFHSFHRHILHEHELKNATRAIKQQLWEEYPSTRSHVDHDAASIENWLSDDHLHVDGFHLHLPPMLFGADVLLIRTPSGNAININAIDAIYAWTSQHTPERTAAHPLVIPKVPFSHGWMLAMRNRLEEARSNAALQKALEASHIPVSETPDEAAIVNAVRAHDWTFSSDYCFSLLAKPAHDQPTSLCLKNIVCVRDLQQLPSPLPEWTLQSDASLVLKHGPPALHHPAPAWSIHKTEHSLIDYEMLKRRDLPILFYDEMVLYQDDLEDCGEVIVEAKVRVMPTCWFLLYKHFVRVDNTLVRCRETRMYHCFSEHRNKTQEVQVEVVWREQTLANEADSAKAMASLPKQLMRTYNKDATNDLPCINEQAGVHQFYTLVQPST